MSPVDYCSSIRDNRRAPVEEMYSLHRQMDEFFREEKEMKVKEGGDDILMSEELEE